MNTITCLNVYVTHCGNRYLLILHNCFILPDIGWVVLSYLQRPYVAVMCYFLIQNIWIIGHARVECVIPFFEEKLCNPRLFG